MKLYEKTIHELSDMLKNKEVKSTEITESVLNRIEEVDGKIGGYISVCAESAMEQAKAADAKIASGEEIADLCGIPA